MLSGAGGQNLNWLHTHGNYDQTRYYGGNQINTGNVKKLRPAFVVQTDVMESMETAPIVVDGIMYLTTSYNHVYAVDAAPARSSGTTSTRWGRSPPSAAAPTTAAWRSARPAVHGNAGCQAVALDAKTGKLLWADADRGSGEGLLAKPWRRSSWTDKVLIGTNGGEYGIRGFVKAFDANNGKLLWTFYTIPEKGHEGVWAKNDATGRDMKRDIAAEKAPSPRTRRSTRPWAAACG